MPFVNNCFLSDINNSYPCQQLLSIVNNVCNLLREIRIGSYYKVKNRNFVTSLTLPIPAENKVKCCDCGSNITSSKVALHYEYAALDVDIVPFSELLADAFGVVVGEDDEK